MSFARVQISEDKANTVKALRAKEDGTGVFLTYADVITFAAALGFRHQRRLPLGKFSRKDPDPIPQDQFKNRALIELIAIAETQDPKILASDEEADQARVKIFQEYANGGLELLQNEIRAVEKYKEQILLILYSEKNRQIDGEEDLDINKIF
jgi:dnd system-associated protein 4